MRINNQTFAIVTSVLMSLNSVQMTVDSSRTGHPRGRLFFQHVGRKTQSRFGIRNDCVQYLACAFILLQFQETFGYTSLTQLAMRL